MNGKTAQEKYEIFLRKHKGVERYVPKYKIKSSKHMVHTILDVQKRRRQRTELVGNRKGRGIKEIERNTKKQEMSMSG